MKITINPFPGYLLLTCMFGLFGCGKKDSNPDIPTQAKFAYVSLSSVPVTVAFVNTSTDPAGVTSAYRWDFGDGSSAQTQDATHTYTSPGVYIVRLFQTPSAGAADSVSMSLNLSSAPGPSGESNRLHGIQTASFTFSIISRAYSATFSNTSVNAGSYIWKFGDGTTSTTDSSIFTHKYMAAGTYHVHLTASGSNGTDTSGAIITF